ncbi:MAG TPA: ADP-ribosylglycohydrolase family protein [Coleofasciculaceae cyanobacterium]
MRYSLLNRFRGALLGSLVGEILGSGSGLVRVLDKPMLTPPKPDDSQLSQTLLAWSQIAACGTESLIRCGKLDIEDWVLHTGMMQSSLLLLKGTANSSEAALATLPIGLFFHEDEVKLRQQLLQGAALWLEDSTASEGVLAVAFAIALALTEKLDVATLIPRTLAYLGTSQTPLGQQLEQVQTLLQQGAGLDRTLTQLHREAQRRGTPLGRPYTSIALAFYCFLSTPEDFRLCVTRAARTGCQSQITASLTGTLAGVYNSIIGIPVSWRLTANQISIGIQKLQQADRLLAVWSGVYDVSVVDQCQWTAVAAPRVIQPR